MVCFRGKGQASVGALGENSLWQDEGGAKRNEKDQMFPLFKILPALVRRRNGPPPPSSPTRAKPVFPLRGSAMPWLERPSAHEGNRGPCRGRCKQPLTHHSLGFRPRGRQADRILRGQTGTFWPVSGGLLAQPRNRLCLSLPCDRTKLN